LRTLIIASFYENIEHQPKPGQLTGGWMTKLAGKPVSAGFGKLLDIQGELAKEEAAAPPPPKKDGETKIFTLQEVQKHNTEVDVWIVVNNRVDDCTEYLDLHPGGVESITINAGDNATEDFAAIHSAKATKMLEKYYIGDLDPASVPKKLSIEDDRFFPGILTCWTLPFQLPSTFLVCQPENTCSSLPRLTEKSLFDDTPPSLPTTMSVVSSLSSRLTDRVSVSHRAVK
jgi:cytochrome b involved in lipid metabolism